jgi:hypothetical protein
MKRVLVAIRVASAYGCSTMSAGLLVRSASATAGECATVSATPITLSTAALRASCRTSRNAPTIPLVTSSVTTRTCSANSCPAMLQRRVMSVSTPGRAGEQNERNGAL